MKITSEFLAREFDVDIFEKEENGRLIKVIKHDSLRDILLNQLVDVKATYSVVCHDINHSVVICTVSDKNGRSITEVGETLDATLVDEISKNHPTLIAFQRAFDRAMIAYLNFEGKVLSNIELGIPMPDTSKKEESDMIEETISNDTELMIEEEIKEEPSEINYEDEIIAWGQYKKSPKRAGDIVVAGNESWLEWVIYKLAPANKEAIRVQEILRKVNEVKKIV